MPAILIIEDNPDNRDMLARRLKRRGFEVSAAEDGERGLLTARAAPPDLILLDLNLPGIDGLEVVRRLRADEALREIPVVALTAHAMVGDRELALQAGCDDYDTKPVDLARLMGKINALLR